MDSPELACWSMYQTVSTASQVSRMLPFLAAQYSACSMRKFLLTSGLLCVLLQGMKITLRRPIYNPSLLVPGTAVAIDIPSITAVLAESEYQFITSMAGDNFSEALKVPQAAQWLQQYYSAEPMVAVPELAGGEGGDTAAPEQTGSPRSSRQELFKQAVHANKAAAQKPPIKVVTQCCLVRFTLHARWKQLR